VRAGACVQDFLGTLRVVPLVPWMAIPRVLVIDDDPALVRMVSVALAHHGFETVEAGDGEAGLAAARARVPDVILSDVMMPRMDGWALVEKLRSEPELAAIPVIFLTALTGADERARGFSLGVDDYIPKPFKLEELELRVRRALARRAHLAYFAQGLARARRARAPSARVVFAGTLAELRLPSLLTLLKVDGKDGVLRLTRGSEVGEVVVRAGQVVRACIPRLDPVEGPQAIAELEGWKDGAFEFRADDAADEIDATELLEPT
jgi:DNA-binding response OmpR family regulator